jgi:hypothetical protein
MLEMTREIAMKVRDTVDAGLSHGKGQPVPGQMCVEAAVCFAMGLPHGDNPTCVAPVLRYLKIGLNDRQWSSKAARAKGLRRLAVAQLGSAGHLDEQEFRRRVVDMTIRRSVPSALRSAAKVNPQHAEALEAAAVRCDQEGTRESARNANDVARKVRADAAAYAAYAAYAYAAAAADAAAYAAYAAYAYAAAAADAAAYAAYAAYAYAAAADAAYAYAAAAADAAAYAAYAAYAYAAAADAAAADAAAADARDTSLAEYAEWVVEILIDMQAPGCEWLDLVPKAA